MRSEPKEVVSIEGMLLMLDDATLHVAVPVQAIRDDKITSTVLSDERGKYQFINLKPGRIPAPAKNWWPKPSTITASVRIIRYGL